MAHECSVVLKRFAEIYVPWSPPALRPGALEDFENKAILIASRCVEALGSEQQLGQTHVQPLVDALKSVTTFLKDEQLCQQIVDLGCRVAHSSSLNALDAAVADCVSSLSVSSVKQLITALKKSDKQNMAAGGAWDTIQNSLLPAIAWLLIRQDDFLQSRERMTEFHECAEFFVLAAQGGCQTLLAKVFKAVGVVFVGVMSIPDTLVVPGVAATALEPGTRQCVHDLKTAGMAVKDLSNLRDPLLTEIGQHFAQHLWRQALERVQDRL